MSYRTPDPYEFVIEDEVEVVEAAVLEAIRSGHSIDAFLNVIPLRKEKSVKEDVHVLPHKEWKVWNKNRRRYKVDKIAEDVVVQNVAVHAVMAPINPAVAAKRIGAALLAAGYKIMAREPTEAMREAGHNLLQPAGGVDTKFVYRAMWDAAP